ncbi:Uncharacterised protein [Dorea longicatena]|nr:Uncharacterised protein [Dorea longicatena]
MFFADCPYCISLRYITCRSYTFDISIIIEVTTLISFHIFYTTCIRSRFCIFFHKAYFQCLDLLTKINCSCYSSCRFVITPANLCQMYTVIHFIILCDLTSQLHSDRFNSLTLTACSCKFTILFPALPSNSLYICLIFYISCIVRIRKCNLYCLNSFSLSGCPCNLIITYFFLPSNRLYMGLILNSWYLISFLRTSWCTFTFFH